MSRRERRRVAALYCFSAVVIALVTMFAYACASGAIDVRGREWRINAHFENVEADTTGGTAHGDSNF